MKLFNNNNMDIVSNIFDVKLPSILSYDRVSKLEKKFAECDNIFLQNFSFSSLAYTSLLVKFLFCPVFTALHGMQTRSSDENSVCPSVRHTRGL